MDREFVYNFIGEIEDDSILQEADRLVSYDRQQQYGHPTADFKRIAAFWSIIFDTPVSAEQVPLAMIALKMSREMNLHKRDNLVDIAGYAKTLDMLND